MTAPIGPPPSAAPGSVILDAETGLRRTTVQQFGPGDDYRWWIRPGDRSPSPLTVPPTGLAALVTATVDPACRLVLPSAHQRGVVYRTTSALSAAFWLRTGEPGRTHVLPALRSVGDALDRLHRVAAAEPVAPPPAVTRVLQFLDGTAPEPGASRLYELALRSWGVAGLDVLRSWATPVCGVPGGLLHGNVSLGALLPSIEQPGRAELLTGADLSSGPAEFDFGWLLGELLELAFVGADRTAGTPPTLAQDEPARSLLRGRGDLDPVLLGRVMVLRVVTHLHDFAAYMPWSDEVADYVDLVRTLLADAPDRLLPEASDV